MADLEGKDLVIQELQKVISFLRIELEEARELAKRMEAARMQERTDLLDRLIPKRQQERPAGPSVPIRTGMHHPGFRPSTRPPEPVDGFQGVMLKEDEDPN